MKRSLLLFAGLLLGMPGVAVTADPPAATYHQISKMAIGGKGAWDYLTLDSASRRLYITRTSHVSVVNVDTGKIVGDIDHTAGVHGVALAPALGRGFLSCGGDGTVVIFDLKTLKEIGRAKAGSKPDAICYDPASKRVFVFNGGSQNATVLDAASGKVAGTIALGGKPEFAVADEQGQVFVNLEDKSQTLALDTRALSVKQRWSLAPGEGPTGLAIDRPHHRLFAACGNEKMVVLDTATGKVIASPAIGKGADAAVFDPGTGLAFSSNGEDGTLTILREDTPAQVSVVGTVPTKAGARTMALDPTTHNVYLATAAAEPIVGKVLSRFHRGYKPNSFVILVYGK